jgi:hypothetical protein
MGAVLFVLEPYSFFAAGLAGMATYLFFLWFTKAVAADEIASLFSRRDAGARAEVEAPLP